MNGPMYPPRSHPGLLTHLKINSGCANSPLQEREASETKMQPASVSGIATGDKPVSYWPVFFSVPSYNPRSLCES